MTTELADFVILFAILGVMTEVLCMFPVSRAVAKWIGNRIADMGGSRTPGGKK